WPATSRRRTPRSSRAAGSEASTAGLSSPARRWASSASAGPGSRGRAALSGWGGAWGRTNRMSRRGASPRSVRGAARPPRAPTAAAASISRPHPVTPETRGSIGAAAFEAMRPGVRIVNAARGPLLDEEALLAALHSGRVAGAALDVFGDEPYSGPLLELDNV